jgi:uncharacterized protein
MSQLLDIVVCPKCHGALEPGEELLRCCRCRVSYPVRDGIPVLLACEALADPASNGCEPAGEGAGGQPQAASAILRDNNP